MRLLSLSLRNFRQHADTHIDFHPGLTGIVGPNGAGKSTLLEAIAWALYGAAAARGTNDTLRFTRAPRGARVQVELAFVLGDHRYRVLRWLAGAEVYLDDEPAPVASTVGGATAFLQARLGMSREEFFNTYFTGQKELHFLGALGAAERGRFLSRMLGYERLRRAQERARGRRAELRQETRELRAALGDAETVSHARSSAALAVAEVAATLNAEMLAARERLLRLEQAPALERQYAAELEELREARSATRAAVEEAKTAWLRDRQDAETKLQGYRDRGIELREQIRRIREVGAQGACPTCGRPVGADYERLLGEMEDQWQAVVQDGRWWKSRFEQLESRPEEIVDQDTRLRELERQVEELTRKHTRCRAAVEELAVARAEVERREAGSGGRLEVATALRAAEAAEAEQRRRGEVVGEREMELAYHEELDRAFTELRHELNSRLRPELAEIASGFIADLTDGRYTSMSIGEGFDIFVVDEGEEKPVISGGEEDIANLVLRLSLSRMIAERAGHPLSLLILDEVFGSLDVARRDNVVRLLHRLGDRFEQVIVITHLEEIQESLGRVLRVDLDERTGSSRVREEAFSGGAPWPLLALRS